MCSEFVSEMETLLKDAYIQQSVPATKATNFTPQQEDTPLISILSGPLKSSRESKTGGDKKEQGGGARLLTTALQSSRTTKSNADIHVQAREVKISNKRQEFSIGEEGGRHKRIRNEPVSAPPRPPVDPKDPVAYFEEMNRIARESGFKNAQEMMVSQKELIALMAGGVPTAAVAMPMAVQPPPPSYPPSGFYHPAPGYFPPAASAGYYPAPYASMGSVLEGGYSHGG
jgi:hypothetical protein